MRHARLANQSEDVDPWEAGQASVEYRFDLIDTLKPGPRSESGCSSENSGQGA